VTIKVDPAPASEVTVGTVRFGNRLPLALIAGPCALESRAHALEMAGALKEIAARAGIGLVYKTSFDKANRTSARSARGLGLDKAPATFADIRETLGVPVLTDVHEAEHCARLAEVVDVLQIPAFLCRQTDLLVAAGRTGKPVNVKKGQWMTPEAMAGALEKVRGGKTKQVAVTERGTFFGYGDLVVDMRSFRRLKEACGAPVVFDATHSVQQPGKGQGGASGGQRDAIPALLLAAAAAGADGFFLETHPDPDKAPSDGPNMVPLKELDDLVARALDVWHAARDGGAK
jgi:2-dehydro-3-deoxyphosphooctonate aldolase (KDO 8-P synthase)